MHGNRDQYIEDGQDGEEGSGSKETLRGLLDLCFDQSQSGQYVPRPDISQYLDDEQISAIKNVITTGHDVDTTDRKDDEKIWETALDQAMQVYEEKTSPWPGAANIKYPLLTTAAIQFNARSYPEIIRPFESVRCRVVGVDPDGSRLARATRVGKHMSWQLSEQMVDWEEDSDKLLLALPIMGSMFRKTFFDPTQQSNSSELIYPQYFIVNKKAKSLKTARRCYQIIKYYKNEIEELQRSGVWRDIDLSLTSEGMDDDPDYEFWEVHFWFDLDDDGYQEPYCGVYHDDSGELVRLYPRFDPVVAVQSGYGQTKPLSGNIFQQNSVRKAGVVINTDGKIIKIWPTEYFTKFSFWPSPDGNFYDMGLGKLLYPLSEAINTTFNQMLDAGTLANQKGGFITRGLRLKAGQLLFKPFEFKPVDCSADELKNGLVPFDFSGPNPVIFNLLGMLVEQAKDIANSKDVLTGESLGKNESPTTVMSLIEQGLKVFNGIYKRVLRSFKDEYQKLFRLNRIYMNPQEYIDVLNEQIAISQQDYFDDLDVQPVADPNLVTDMQRYAKAEALMKWGMGNPLANQIEVQTRYLLAIGAENPEKLIQPPNNQPPLDLIAKLKESEANVKKSEEDALNKRVDTLTKLMGIDPNSIPMLAMTSEKLQQVIDDERNEQSGVGGMEGPPDNQASLGIHPGLPPSPGNGMVGSPQPSQPGIAPAGMPVPANGAEFE